MSTTLPFAAAGTCALALLFAASSASAQSTFAHWNFDSGRDALSLAALPSPDVAGPGYLIHGYDNLVGPTYSSETAKGTGLSCRFKAPQDGYTLDANLNAWSPLQWTIEISVRLDKIEGWNTIIGRDGTSWTGSLKSDFYLQKKDVDNRFRLDFATLDGSRYVVDSTFAASRGTWYHLALVSDGKTVSMFVNQNDGAGYQLAGSAVMNTLPGANNALATSGSHWTFGRGWYGGKQVDNIEGCIDDVRFTDGALAPAAFLHAPAAITPTAGLDLARNGREVSLSWSLPPGTMRRVNLYRHDREDASGRTLIATLYPPAKIYLDQVPNETSTYWYWAEATTEDGRTLTLGPAHSPAGEVWAP